MTTHAHQPTAIDHPTVVIGGGLAGLAAAVSLAQQGVPVTLLETRKRLGGRATSFEDPATGDTLDNCQHVLLRACTSLLDFYERLGVADRVQWHRKLYFAYRDEQDQPAIDTLEGDDLPAPMHLVRSLWKFKGLTLREKFAIARGMLSILQISRRGRDLYADVSFADFLAEQNQPQPVIDKFWKVVIVSACNETIDNVAASYAIQVFQEGFLYRGEAYEMGLPTVPLEDLYDPAEQVITAAGGRVLSGIAAESIVFDGEQVAAIRLTDGQEIAGSSFISAVPFDRLAKLAPADMKAADPRLAVLDELKVSPIIGIHLFVRPSEGEGPVMSLPHLVLRDSPLHWVFNKGIVKRGEHAGTQHLHGVISAAHERVDQSADDILTLAMRECRRFVPGFDDAVLAHGRVIKEKRATFSVQPGVDDKRPTTTGPIGNLLLAGDWVDTGWPATMEGAVRSGYTAAAAVLSRAGAEASEPVEDLEPGLLYQALAG